MGVAKVRRRSAEIEKMSSLEEGSVVRPKTKQEIFAKMMRQVAASVFFGVSSVLIITVNKTVLTTYKSVDVLIDAHLYTRCVARLLGEGWGCIHVRESERVT